MYLSRHLIKFNNNYTDLYMGADTYPSTGGGALVTPIRVEVNRLVEKYDYGGNVGLYLSITGAKAYDDMVYSGNSALYIPNGNIQGFRLRQRRVTSSEELSKMDSIILSKASSDITLTFPSGCEDGQMFIIKKQGMGNVTVSASGGDMIANKIDEIVLTVTIIRGWCYTFYYDAFKKQWWHTRAADAWST